MSHPIYKVITVEVLGPSQLRVGFDDGTSQDIDFEGVLFGELYGPLKDPELFKQVSIDPEVKTLVWPNGADFDPATLHDWPRLKPLLEQQAKSWNASAQSGATYRK